MSKQSNVLYIFIDCLIRMLNYISEVIFKGYSEIDTARASLIAAFLKRGAA